MLITVSVKWIEGIVADLRDISKQQREITSNQAEAHMLNPNVEKPGLNWAVYFFFYLCFSLCTSASLAASCLGLRLVCFGVVRLSDRHNTAAAEKPIVQSTVKHKASNQGTKPNIVFCFLFCIVLLFY